MKAFKVVCISDKGWVMCKPREIIKRKFFGLIKTTEMVYDKPPGPSVKEVCTVTDEIQDDGEVYYRLSEYLKNGIYTKRGFKRIDEATAEFEEVTFDEIKKQQPVSAN